MGMKLKEAIAVYGNKRAIAKTLEMNPSTVGRWNPDRIPMARAWQLHMLSFGKLPFDPKPYTK